MPSNNLDCSLTSFPAQMWNSSVKTVGYPGMESDFRNSCCNTFLHSQGKTEA